MNGIRIKWKPEEKAKSVNKRFRDSIVPARPHDDGFGFELNAEAPLDAVSHLMREAEHILARGAAPVDKNEGVFGPDADLLFGIALKSRSVDEPAGCELRAASRERIGNERRMKGNKLPRLQFRNNRVLEEGSGAPSLPGVRELGRADFADLCLNGCGRCGV